MMSSHREQDPYAAFEENAHEDTEESSLRDSSCGVLVHHEGTEQALLLYLQEKLPTAGGLDPRDKVLNLIDQFCMSRHWMMNVGDKKGVILQDFLTNCVEARLLADNHEPFVIVEVGTYCGYSLIRMADTLMRKFNNSPFHIFTVDVNPKYQAVAREILRLSQVDAFATFLQVGDSTGLNEVLLHSISAKYPDHVWCDFVFFDHDKDAYLADLQVLENSGMIRAGTHVCADNVVFFRLDDYRMHMNDLASRGIVETRLELMPLEYVTEQTKQAEAPGQDLLDGVELTIYRKDPSLSQI